MISPSPNVFHSAHEDRGGEDLSALSPAKAVASITVAEMKSVLRQADCLYDKPEIWRQLGVTGVSEIPDSVIQEAYEVGGRIILRCSSVVEKAFALRRVGICISNLVQNAIKFTKDGLGLGLTIARRAVSLCNGTLTAHDIKGKGCVFRIELPEHPQASHSVN